ncbi:hypothetical protein B0H34DRAFT_793047 [Crassisporium funariophilum]|nr:hypothetical protein B0H34DRAFT_793047 [Crassisporium funariophilum]
MPPKVGLPAGIIHLNKVLTHLKASPKLTLTGLKALKLSYAYRNDHFGARHFVKQDLPRIRYANPDLNIQVEEVKKKKEEAWRPEMELEFENGKVQRLDLNDKWSTTILKELMTVAGGDPWKKHVEESTAAGLPVIPGERIQEEMKARQEQMDHLPTLEEWRVLHPQTSEPEKPVKTKKASSSSPPPPETSAGTTAPHAS